MRKRKREEKVVASFKRLVAETEEQTFCKVNRRKGMSLRVGHVVRSRLITCHEKRAFKKKKKKTEMRHLE